MLTINSIPQDAEHRQRPLYSWKQKVLSTAQHQMVSDCGSPKYYQPYCQLQYSGLCCVSRASDNIILKANVIPSKFHCIQISTFCEMQL